MDFLSQLFTDYTFRNVAAGSFLIGVVSGSLGAFAVLRRQSLLGDAISHAALPGVALAFLLTGAKTSITLMVGAGIAGVFGTLLIGAIVGNTRIKYDTALALILSVFFGFGLVLLTFIQRRPDARQAGLDNFLFGQAASLVQRDVVIMLVVVLIATLIVMAGWKHFKILAFDPDFGRTLGMSMRIADVVITILLVVAIVIGLQTVGVVLMSAMIIAPAAAARQWTDRLGRMVLLSACFGAAAGVIGALLSSALTGLPTGPTIVLVAGSLVLFSILFAPNRGLVVRGIRDRRRTRELREDGVLVDMHRLAEQHDDEAHPHPESVLDLMSPGRRSGPTLRALHEKGLVVPTGPHEWSLTDRGNAYAHDLLEIREPGSYSEDVQ